jgi:glycosyltransferase involved in cell wall biosynthesis
MALRPGEPPYANYDNDNDEDEDEDENENAVDDDGFPLILRRARVLLATDSLGPVNGVSRTTRTLIEYLTRHGVDLVVVAPRHESRVGLDEATVNNMTIRLPGCLLPYYPDLTIVYPFRLDRLAVPPGWQPDLIYLASPASVGFPLLTQIRQLRRPPPVLLNFQTDLSSYSEIVLPPLLARGAVALLALVQGILFRHSSVHTVFYPCSDIGRYLEGTGVPRDRMVRLGRGVDTVMFHPLRRDDAYRRQLAPNGEIILVCVCRLGLEKGFDFLARVAIQLVAAALPFKLLIVGGNRNPAVEDDLRRLFEPVKDRVVFTGFLTGEPLARAYAVGDLFLHCSITETFGLVVLEAMASGVPVIARNRGGPSDIICHEKTGYLEDPNDVNRFVQRILQVSSDPDLRARLSTAARQFAEDTTWEKINRRVARQLADALKERQRQRQRQPQRKLLHTTAGTDSLLPSRSSPPPVTDNGVFPVQRWAEQLRLHAAMGLIWIVWTISVVPLLMHGNRAFGSKRRESS